ncbi:hypothetical protein AWB69_06479 [Caballeronia udeis]|uniref:Uncharacterized protein n=1 Tax=Caballeronia udeis TaxID=1232866 RepID=A0A158IQ83_9BURK|nr:hypothetical protein [Caballeronia udeis]SAL58695.1 hypothetical protein AWB69_06479 [Caballeronia udeis]
MIQPVSKKVSVTQNQRPSEVSGKGTLSGLPTPAGLCISNEFERIPAVDAWTTPVNDSVQNELRERHVLRGAVKVKRMVKG